MNLRTPILLFTIMLSLLTLKAQDKNKIDSLTRELKKAKDPDARYKLYGELSALDTPKNKYKGSMLLNAELSGNTELQLKTYSFFASSLDDSAQFYIDKMFELAKEKKNKQYQGWYYLFSGQRQYFLKNNMDKGMELLREANTIAVNDHFDTLAYVANQLMGFIHASKGEKLLEYKSYMTQLSLAENIGDGKMALSTYWQIFWFYSRLKQYPKAKEYALKILETGKKKNWPDWIEGGHHLLTHYYTNVGEFEIAKYYYDETKKLRKQNNTDLAEDDDLLDIYSNANDYEKMLRVLQKDDIKKGFFKKGDINSTPYNYYGQLATCYTKLGKADSAYIFLRQMKEAMDSKNMNNWQYFALQGNYFKLLNNADSAAVYYGKADSAIGYANNVDARIERYANLDTLFSQKGNYQKAYQYKTLWMQYKDSAAALSKQGDLVVMEIDNENQRMEAERRASHNIQYMGITAGLAAVFILLVLMGVFSSSAGIIRALSFFSFIFFFEFLILLFDNVIHEVTHGEPWKVLSIKIVMIAMLLPLHHYIEHKVVHHLLHRKKVSLLIWKKAKRKIPVPVKNSQNIIE